MIGTGAVPAPELRRQAERRARPPPRVLGRPPAARRGEDHVLPGQRTAGACAAGRADRPGDAALATGGSALQEQLEYTYYSAAGVRTQAGSACGPTSRRSATRGCPPRRRADDQPAPANRTRDARPGTGSATTTRSGASSVHRQVDQAAQAEPRAREALLRPPEPRISTSTSRRGTSSTTPTTPRRSRRTRARLESTWASRSWTCRSTTTRSRRGGLRHHHPVAEPPATLTEYGGRGVPNLYITRCYMSTGDWNASHYKNPEFDRLARTFLGAAEIGAQRGRRRRWRASSSATRRSSPTTSSTT